MSGDRDVMRYSCIRCRRILQFLDQIVQLLEGRDRCRFVDAAAKLDNQAFGRWRPLIGQPHWHALRLKGRRRFRRSSLIM